MVQMSMVKRSREAKKNAAIAAISFKLAKQNNDVLYKKSRRFKGLFVAAKRAINAKYASRAKQEWAKLQNQPK